MANEYDFYAMGMRYADRVGQELNKMAEEIGEKYGANAKVEFEAGIAVSIVPMYSDTYEEFSSKEYETRGYVPVTTDYGKENSRNNGYVGGTGTGIQYDQDGRYNDPLKSSKHHGK